MIFIANDDFCSIFEDVLDAAGKGRFSVPFGTPSDGSQVTLTPFGISAFGGTFSNGWSLTITEGSEAQNCKMFCDGSISYEPAVNRIILHGEDCLGDVRRQERVPDWFPTTPTCVVYTGIDETATRDAILTYLNANASILAAIKNFASSTTTAAEFADAFIAGNATELPFGIPVPAGETIGVAKANGTGNRALSIGFQEQLDDAVFLDPAIFFVHFESFFDDLSSHPSKVEMQQIFAGVAANGNVHYVKEGGGSIGPFTASNPAGSLTAAVSAASDNDTIVVDSGTDPTAPTVYSESATIDITKSINITSLAKNDPTSTASPGFPVIDGGGAHQVFRINEVTGYVGLANLEISNGNAAIPSGVDTSTTTEIFGGGGVLINRSHKTYLANCLIQENVTESVGSWRLHGFGGGVYAYYSSSFLYRNRITGNESGDRGGGVGIGGYGWPVLAENYIDTNVASGRRADGGGVGVEIGYPTIFDQAWTSSGGGAVTADLLRGLYSDPSWTDLGWDSDELAQAKWRRVIFRKNTIAMNTAEDDGGGVYMSVLSLGYFEDNVITGNTATNDGGGIRNSFGSSIEIRGGEITNNRANTAQRSAGGGGISSKNASLKMYDVDCSGNYVEDYGGGGVYFLIQNYGSFVGPDSEDSDQDEISELDQLPSEILDILGVDFDGVQSLIFGQDRMILAIVASSVAIRENTVSKITTAAEDQRRGGGVFIHRSDEKGSDVFEFDATIYGLSNIKDNHINDDIDAHGTVVSTSTSAYPDSTDLHVEDDITRPGDPITDANSSDAEFQTAGHFHYFSS